MEDTAQSQSQANTMVMTLTVQVFPKMSSNHTVQKHTGVANIYIGVGSPGICTRFFPHWVKALAPEDIDCLTHCRAVRHAPVLRPRSSLDGHLRQLQDTEASCVLSCYYMTAAISWHIMNPKNQSILHSLTTVDILLINRIDGLEFNVAARMPHECHTKIQGAAQKIK